MAYYVYGPNYERSYGYSASPSPPVTSNYKSPTNFLQPSQLSQEFGAHIIDAVRSLYFDRIRPEIGTVKKRLEEHHPETLIGKINEDNLREAVHFLQHTLSVKEHIDPKGRQQYMIMLEKNIPFDFKGFVDPMALNEAEIPYSAEVFRGLEVYINELCRAGDSRLCSFGGGRYGCAKKLRDANLNFLAGLSLGEICHIVQILVHREVLAYSRQGAIIPFRFSLSALKAKNAHELTPTRGSRNRSDVEVGKTNGVAAAASSKVPTLPVVDSEELLVNVIESIIFPEVRGDIPSRSLLLSNLKSEVRERFGLELSETRLGATKLVDLLTLPCLANVCCLDWRRNNPTIVPHQSVVQGRAPTFGLLESNEKWVTADQSSRTGRRAGNRNRKLNAASSANSHQQHTATFRAPHYPTNVKPAPNAMNYPPLEVYPVGSMYFSIAGSTQQPLPPPTYPDNSPISKSLYPPYMASVGDCTPTGQVPMQQQPQTWTSPLRYTWDSMNAPLLKTDKCPMRNVKVKNTFIDIRSPTLKNQPRNKSWTPDASPTPLHEDDPLRDNFRL